LRLFICGMRQWAMLRKPPTSIEAVQRRRLRSLVAHAKAHSPFYAERLRNIDPDRFELSDLPTVTKTQMMQNFDHFLTDRQAKLRDLEAFVSDAGNLGQWFHGKYVVTRTSGSQGLPAVIVQDRGVMELLFALEAGNCPVFPSSPLGVLQRVFHRTRLAAVTIGRGFYPSAVGLACAPKAMRLFLDRLWLAKIHPFEEVVAELNRFRPHVLLAYANVLEMLAREELAGRLHLNAGGPLRQVINMSEPLSRGA